MPALLVSHKKPGYYFRVLQEGEVEAGDEIVKVANGPERMTVAEIDGMLYLASHSREQLERALRIPALSPGWKTSFQALLEQILTGETAGGNPGLAPSGGPPPAWQGFRPLRVSQMERESRSVLSLVLVPADKHPLVAALPGQFVVLRLQPGPDAPPLLRNYSLSDTPSAEHYRVSVKQEANGAASTYVHHQVRIGDVLDVSAPRGTFTFRPGNSPVVLLSAGVGATPVLSMLHALVSEAPQREVWWLFGPGASSTPGVVDAASRPPHLPARSPGTGPLVSFARSGLVVHWDPALQSLLELAEACDVPVIWSCRTGVCHTCEGLPV